MATVRIAVIEDEHPIRRGVVDALRASGYEVAEAADGDSGLREASKAGVDLVLLDLLLPKRSGEWRSFSMPKGCAGAARHSVSLPASLASSRSSTPAAVWAVG